MKRGMATLFAVVLLGMVLGVGLNIYASTYLVWTGESNDQHTDGWASMRSLWKDGFEQMGYSGSAYFAPSLSTIKNNLYTMDVYSFTAHSCGSSDHILIRFLDGVSYPEGIHCEGMPYCGKTNYLKANPLSGPTCDDVYKIMWGRGPLTFAFLGSCQAMASVGYPSWADAFTGGGQAESVVVGYKNIYIPGTNYWCTVGTTGTDAYHWQEMLLIYLNAGVPVRQALFVADYKYPGLDPCSCMFGDEFVNLTGTNRDTAGLTCGMGNNLYWNLNFDNNSYSEAQIPFATIDDKPVAGDWDNDEWDEIGAFRSSTAMWYLDYDNDAVADRSFMYGIPGDIPVTGDWNGNGTDTIGVHRPGNCVWYLRNTNNGGIGDIEANYGIPGDTPVVGDWDGDGVDTIGVYRSSNCMWYLRNTNTSGPGDIEANYGIPGDIPVVGDWDGDGVDTIGVYRPSNGTWHLRNTNTSGVADESFEFHDCTTPLDPITGFWQPPDGDDEMALAAPSPLSQSFCYECTAPDIQQLNVYPNPTQHETVTFQVTGQNVQSIEVKLFDLSGQLIWSSGCVPGDQTSWGLTTQNGEQVANGVYLYSAEVQNADGSMWTSKVGKLLVLK